jgi:hypothetical protein
MCKYEIKIPNEYEGTFLKGIIDALISGYKNNNDVKIEFYDYDREFLLNYWPTKRRADLGLSRAAILYINDKMVIIDEDDQCGLTQKFKDEDCIKLSMSLQYKKCNDYDGFKFPITAWCYQENTKCRGIDCFSDQRIIDINRLTKKVIDCGFCGRIHKGRRGIIRDLEESGMNMFINAGKFIYTNQELAAIMTTWKSALVPYGKYKRNHLDGKTWREIECAALGIPMIMQGDRNYWIPLEPYKHYIPYEDFDSIEDAINVAINTEGLIERAQDWFNELNSKDGMCKTFLEILDTYL